MTKQKKPSYKELEKNFRSVVVDLDSYTKAYRDEERKNTTFRNTIREGIEREKKLEREVAWFKQLAQQMSEAVCTYMRNR